MTKVLVKAYIPTIDEKRGISLDDIIDGGSLRYVRPGERNIGMDARNLSRHQRTARGANIPYEIDAHKQGGISIPGLLDLDNPTKINPNFNITGTYVGPPNQGFLRRPDMSFRRDSPAVLLASTQNPEWWRTMAEGAITPAEGYKYGGFDKDTVVEIPLPKGASTPQHLVHPSSQEALDFLSQFPSMAGSQQWRQKAGPRMDINQLIASGKLQPLSLDQRIQPHESPFLDDDVTEIVTGEPMDIAMRLLKLELAPPMIQGVKEQVPMQQDIPMVDMAMGDYESPCECAERIRSEVLSLLLQELEKPNRSQSDIDSLREQYQEWQGHACQEILEWAEGTDRFNYCNNNMSEADQMKYTGEPMDLAFDAIKKNLNRWFKEKWVDVSRKDKDGKHPPCGRSKASKSSKGYPKCRPSVKVSSKTPKTSGSMSEGQKRAATKRKRSKKQGVGGKPTIVKVE
tara:strand:- start:1091 stop:2458 length:1368 start_codon:yes stop_codon:yes gene_type:complete